MEFASHCKSCCHSNSQDQEFVTFSDQENEILLENQAVRFQILSHAVTSNVFPQVFPDCETLKIEQDFNGVHYEADEASIDDQLTLGERK